MTYDRAYCLYPRATLGRKTTLALRVPTPNTSQYLRKYNDRGFDVVRLALPEHRELFALDCVRWVGDKHSWMIELLPVPSWPSWLQYVSPAAVTTWSVTMFLQDHHSVYYNIWTDEPSMFPLIIASDNVQEVIGECIEELGELVDEVNPTINGCDRFVFFVHEYETLFTSS